MKYFEERRIVFPEIRLTIGPDHRDRSESVRGGDLIRSINSPTVRRKMRKNDATSSEDVSP